MQRNADLLSNGFRTRVPPLAEHFDVAAGGLEQPLQDLDRGRFAGTIGSQHTKALTFFDGEINTTDSLDRRFARIRLDEFGALNGERHGGHRLGVVSWLTLRGASVGRSAPWGTNTTAAPPTSGIATPPAESASGFK